MKKLKSSFIPLILFLSTACGKPPQNTITFNFSVPKSTINSSNLKAASSLTPIAYYIEKITDESGTTSLCNSCVASSSNGALSVTLMPSGNLTKIKVTGYYFAFDGTAINNTTPLYFHEFKDEVLNILNNNATFKVTTAPNISIKGATAGQYNLVTTNNNVKTTTIYFGKPHDGVLTIKLPVSKYFGIQQDQDSSKIYSFTANSPTAASQCTSNNSYGRNASGDPIFWKLDGNNIAELNVNSDNLGLTYLDGSSTICGRLLKNLNPSFSDFNATQQAQLQPTNSSNLTRVTSNSFLYDLQTYLNPPDLLLANPDAFPSTPPTLTPNDISTHAQTINTKCVMYYANSDNTYSSILSFGEVDDSNYPIFSYKYADCNNLTTGLYAEFIQPLSTPLPYGSLTYPLLMAYYFDDNDGFAIYNQYTSLSGGQNPSADHPITMSLYSN